MAITAVHGASLMTLSNALVKLHKEQFGRGPTQARAYFAGPDLLVCVLEEVLLPVERKLVELGDSARVRESRMAFQAATAASFIAVVEGNLGRSVRAFATAVDPVANVAFENYWLVPLGLSRALGASSAERPRDRR